MKSPRRAGRERNIFHSFHVSGIVRNILFTATLLSLASGAPLRAQQAANPPAPSVVQPGAPGQPSKALPPTTKGELAPLAQADVDFMQGMIMHHSQAVEMTALIPSHTKNKDILTLGAKISDSQSSEIQFMKRWLTARGEATTMPSDMPGMDMPGAAPLMPGMLTPAQMDALRKARDAEFDRLFLTGMIQHHGGALVMVKDLFNTAGAGQEAEIFDFATDVDNTQRAEIRIMQGLLEKMGTAGAAGSTDAAGAAKKP